MIALSLIWNYVRWFVLTLIFLNLAQNIVIIYAFWRVDPDSISISMPSGEVFAIAFAVFLGALVFRKITEPDDNDETSISLKKH
ncbi:MAG: hypothetical protein ABJN42_13740 [Roseibium sp.]|uniref:hypothetical protein n=1 Tax=Roseibium sp. TaxID=1936156 RepID=UPI003299BF3F